MAERYKRLQISEQEYFLPECPVSLAAYAVLKDKKEERLLLQFKFQNCTSKTISGIILSVSTYDQLGQEIEVVKNHQYAGINANRGAFFGADSTIKLSKDTFVADITVLVNSVLFSDHSMWTNEKGLVLKKSPPSQQLTDILPVKLIKQYQRSTSSHMKYIPQELSGSWRCSCGSLNIEDCCIVCGVTKEDVFSKCSEEFLIQASNRRVYQEALDLKNENSIDSLSRAIELLKSISGYKDSSHIIEECREDIRKLNDEEEERTIKEKRNKQKRIGIAIFAVVFCALFIAVYILGIKPNQIRKEIYKQIENGEYKEAYNSLDKVTDLGTVKSIKHDMALKLLDSGETEWAYEILEEIDENNVIVEDKRKRAHEYLDSGDFYFAYELFEEIGDDEEIKNSKRKRAEEFLNEKKYGEAYELFKEIGDVESIKKSKNERAEQYIKQEDYEKAYELYKETGNEQAIIESEYNRAVDLVKKEQYDDAYELLKKIDYKDSTALIQKCLEPTYGEELAKRLAKLRIGALYQLGNYHGESNWIILDIDESRVLLVSEKCIDYRPYNEYKTYNGREAGIQIDGIEWQTCSLRYFLNESYYFEAFSPEEQSIIEETEYDDVSDRVFLLDKDQILKYIEYIDLNCKYSLYALNGKTGNDYASWWFRTAPGERKEINVSSDPRQPVFEDFTTVGVYTKEGKVLTGTNRETSFMFSANRGIRPAIWINLDND